MCVWVYFVRLMILLVHANLLLRSFFRTYNQWIIAQFRIFTCTKAIAKQKPNPNRLQTSQMSLNIRMLSPYNNVHAKIMHNCSIFLPLSQTRSDVAHHVWLARVCVLIHFSNWLFWNQIFNTAVAHICCALRTVSSLLNNWIDVEEPCRLLSANLSTLIYRSKGNKIWFKLNVTVYSERMRTHIQHTASRILSDMDTLCCSIKHLTPYIRCTYVYKYEYRIPNTEHRLSIHHRVRPQANTFICVPCFYLVKHEYFPRQICFEKLFNF